MLRFNRFQAVVLAVAIAAAAGVAQLGGVTAVDTGTSTAPPPAVKGGIPMWAPEFFIGSESNRTAATAAADAKRFNVIAAQDNTYDGLVPAMHAANPKVLVLAYINGAFARPGDPSFPEAVYAHHGAVASGNRIHPAAWPQNLLMNVNDARWSTYLVSECKSILAKSGYDGCFMDTVGKAPTLAGYVAPGVPTDPATGKAYTDVQWDNFQVASINRVKAGTNKPIWGNGLGSGGSYAKTKVLLSALGGAMSEDFLRGAGDSPTAYPTESSWLDDVNMVADAQAKYPNAKIVTTTKLYVNATAAQVDEWRLFSLASFMLASNGKAYYGFKSSSTSDGGEWNSHYDLPLGTPTTTTYAHASNGVYSRTFTGGKVLVHPGAGTATVALGGTFKDWSGKSVTSVTLGAHSAQVVVH